MQQLGRERRGPRRSGEEIVARRVEVTDQAFDRHELLAQVGPACLRHDDRHVGTDLFDGSSAEQGRRGRPQEIHALAGVGLLALHLEHDVLHVTLGQRALARGEIDKGRDRLCPCCGPDVVAHHHAQHDEEDSTYGRDRTAALTPKDSFRG